MLEEGAATQHICNRVLILQLLQLLNFYFHLEGDSASR